jgi:hypothetical protein
MKINIIFADVCLPDYWQGSQTAHIGINANKNMTLREIKDAINECLRWGEILGGDNIARLLSADYLYHEQDQKQSEVLFKRTTNAVKRLKLKSITGNKQRRAFDFLNDDSESVAWFYLVEA